MAGHWTVIRASEFVSLRAAWQQINEAQQSVPILDAQFFELLLKHFGNDGLLACVEEHSGGPRSACILTTRKRLAAETFQPSQAPLGAWVSTRRGFDEESLSSLMRAVPSFTALVGLSQLDPMICERPIASSRLRSRDYIQTARLQTEGEFSDYWDKRSKNLRDNLRKQRSRLKKAGIGTRLVTINTSTEMAIAVNEFSQLENEGWKRAMGTALHPDNAQGRFYRELLELYGGRSEGKVYQYFFDDQLVASDLCLIRNGTLIILKTTYNESYSRFSPAMLMREDQLRALFECDRTQFIEFYGPVMDWHRRLTDDIRILFHVNFYRSGSIAKLASLI